MATEQGPTTPRGTGPTSADDRSTAASARDLDTDGKRFTPRSSRAALEPERLPEPKRPSARARHPLVMAGSAIFTLIFLVALVGGIAIATGKHRFEAPGPLDRDKTV